MSLITPSKSNTIQQLYTSTVPNPDAVSIGWTYPAPQNIAMSSLGYLSLFQRMDQNPRIRATQVSTDTLPHYQPFDFNLIGFSMSFELDILAILDIFHQWDLPVIAVERNEHHPLVFAGGPVPITNPEPYADFFDFFLIGEGEELLNELIETYQDYQKTSPEGSRHQLLRHLAAKVPGCYVPSLYHIEYASLSDGPITHIQPKYEDTPAMVEKRIFSREEMANNVTYSPFLTEDCVFPNTFLVEVMRGCAHRCRFCLASYSMLPARGPQLDPLKEAIAFGLRHTNKIGLLGALIADNPEFPELCEFLQHEMQQRPDLKLSSASLRIDTLTPQIAETFKQGGQQQLTFAIESGSERLRRRINKNLKQDKIFDAAEIMFRSGIKAMKLYGMVGLPDESDEDIEALGKLVQDLKKAQPKLELILGCSSFVPKAATPFQWQPRPDNKTIEHRFDMLNKMLLKKAKFRPSSAKWDFLQAVLSRGDRRLTPLIIRFHQFGATLGSLNRAYKSLCDEGIPPCPPPAWYALRDRAVDDPFAERFPWDMIHLGVDKPVLYQEGLPPKSFTGVDII